MTNTISVTKNGVTYNIIDESSAAGTLTKEFVLSELLEAYNSPNITQKLNQIADTNDSSINIYLDKTGTDENGRTISGNAVYKIDGEYAVVLNSEAIKQLYRYRTTADGYSTQPVSGIIVHELGHVHEDRVNGNPPQYITLPNGDPNLAFDPNYEYDNIDKFENVFYIDVAGQAPRAHDTTGYDIPDGHQNPLTADGFPTIHDDVYGQSKASRSAAGSNNNGKSTDNYSDDAEEDYTDPTKEEPTPLVLDIDGDGVELVSLESADAVYWDLDNDGFAEATGWVGPDDGLLAVDTNEDGLINDSAELFGDQTGYRNGFLALAAYDSNGDGVVTDTDDDWDDLLVWIDADTDGYSDYDELYSLDDLLITEIDLGYVEVDYDIADNNIYQESTFTIDGNTNDIVDVYFQYSNRNTVYDELYVFDNNAGDLPQIRGYGTLANLTVAMSLDNDDTDPDSLLSLVTDFATQDIEDIFDTADLWADIADIMFRWAGVDAVATDSRGPNVDARELGYLEAFTGEQWLQRGYYEDPFLRAGEQLQEGFDFVQNAFVKRLLLQTEAGSLIDDVDLEIIEDTLDTSSATLNLTVLDDVETGAASASNIQDYWENVVRFIDEIFDDVDNLTTTEWQALDDAIYASDNTLDLATIVAAIEPAAAQGVSLTGTSSANTLTGSNYDDVIEARSGDDVIDGGFGNDLLEAEYGDDTIHGGDGDDLIYGSRGDDVYVYGIGDDTDTIIELYYFEEDDVIYFETGIDPTDIELTRISNDDLEIKINNAGAYDKIIVENQFSTDSSAGQVEYLEFADSATVIDLLDRTFVLNGSDRSETLEGAERGAIEHDTIYGFDGNDVIYGFSGEDIIYGGDGNDDIYGGNGTTTYDSSDDANTLYGGAGNDIIEGAYDNDLLYGGTGDDFIFGNHGDDTFYFSYGDGNDTYDEIDAYDDDVISFLGAITFADLSFNRISDTDLEILIDDGAGGSITIIDQFDDASSQGFFEQMDFATASSVDFDTISHTLIGTDGDDTLGGVLRGGSPDDYIDGGDGNDIIYGYDGVDIIYGGAGDDEIYGGGVGSTYSYGDGANTIYGEEGHDTIEGGYNDDVIEGGTGNDTLKGSHGDDTLRGDEGNDLLYGLDDEDDLYGGDGNDQLYGQHDSDHLYGGDGDDILDGGNGNDMLYGGDGEDILYGDNGADIFIFEAISAFNDVDTIGDFNTSQNDAIDIYSLLIGYDSQQDDINDFVTMTANGSDTTMAVDRDGTAGTYSFVDVAEITGVTGLVVDDMVSNSELLV